MLGARSGIRLLVDGCKPYGYHSMMPKEPTTQVAFRLSDRLIARVDRHAKRLGKAERGVEFSRADAVRDLLTRALDVVEAGHE